MLSKLIVAAFFLPWFILGRTDGSTRAVMEVGVPYHTCRCSPTVEYGPENGVIMCPNQTQIGMQIVYQDTNAVEGDCYEISSGEPPTADCQTQPTSYCTLNPPALSVNVMNCWANGIFVEATGLQGGSRFFHQDGVGIIYDPNMRSLCRKESPGTSDTYTISVFAALQGGAALGTFTITLNCANCAVQP